MLCINGMFIVVDGVLDGSSLDVGIVSPLATGNVTGTANPNFFNATDQTGTLYQNTTSTVGNSTGGFVFGDNLNPIDTILYPIQIVWNAITLFTGGWLFTAMNQFGFPTVFTQTLQAILGFLAILTVIRFFANRGD